MFLEEYIANINHALKSIKSDISINFICFDYHGLIVTSNKVVSSSDLGVCCGNHLSQRQMIIQAVNLLSWISSGKFTRELNKESLLN